MKSALYIFLGEVALCVAIMAESMELAQQQIAALIYLLECLGFVIHKDKKSVLIDTSPGNGFFGGTTVDRGGGGGGEKIKKI